MAEIATRSQFSWSIFAFLLLPGTAVGGGLGYAAFLRATGARPRRLLIFTPVLFASAVFDPEILNDLIATGMGGGSILVVVAALAAGHALTGHRPAAARIVTGLVAIFGIAAVAGVGAAVPGSVPHTTAVCLLGATLMAVLCLASSIPHSTRPHKSGQAGANSSSDSNRVA